MLAYQLSQFPTRITTNSMVKYSPLDWTRLTHNSYEDGTPAWSPKYVSPMNVERSKGGPYFSFEDCHWLNNMPNSTCLEKGFGVLLNKVTI
ncbi:hypothetical protein CR513_53888, partial [Mucuna pruriens]